MKTPFILTCACAAALVFPLSSCSTQNSSTAGYDTAEPASGEIPPWIAESSDPAYESGHYSPVQSSSSYAYNPPAKPSVTKKSSARKSTAGSKSSRSTAARKSSSRKSAPKARTYTVKKGDKLLEVDINTVKAKGYSLETPVLVTDADQYADVVEMAGQTVKAGEPLLTVLK